MFLRRVIFSPGIIRVQRASMSSNKTPDQPASMLGGHAQFAKGYVEETIGNVTGSKEWKESGKEDSQAGIAEMKAANAHRKADPTPSGVAGRVEELAGKATGCEGMEVEGQERQKQAQD